MIRGQHIYAKDKKIPGFLEYLINVDEFQTHTFLWEHKTLTRTCPHMSTHAYIRTCQILSLHGASLTNCIRRKFAPGPVPYSGTSVPKHGNRAYRNFMQFVKTMYGGTEMVIGISCLVLLSLFSGT